MSPALINLLLNSVLGVLLICTIAYCAQLSRRIRILQNTRGELAAMIQQFDSSTTKATATLAELQTISKKVTSALEVKIERANFLADDLAFLIEKSGKLIAQMEQLKNQQSMVSEQRTSSATAAHEEPRQSSSQQPLSEQPPSIEEVLHRLAAAAAKPTQASTPQYPVAETIGNSARTRVERDLIHALKTNR